MSPCCCSSAGSTTPNIANFAAPGVRSPHHVSASTAPASPSPSAPAPTTSTARPQQAIDGVLMIGDSLGVGTAPFLQAAFGASTKVTSNVKGGRTLAQGMAEYDKVAVKPKVVDMGLFTNDDPANLPALKRAVERTVADAHARGGRVVWATIQRPAVGGRSYDQVNEYLRSMARQHADVMGLVDWQQMVATSPGYVAGDQVHSNAAGYRARAEAFAAASRSPR